METLVTIYIIVVCALSVAVVTAAYANLPRMRCAQHKQRLTDKARVYGSDPLCEIGVSVICGESIDIERVKELLSLDYMRYEVVVVADAEKDENFGLLLQQYAMIRVNLPHIDYNLQASTRRLFRSRQRRYRRLIVVDSSADNTASQLNGAIAVCSFDRILPLEGDTVPYDFALKSLVAELHEHGSNQQYAIVAPVTITDDPQSEVVNGSLVHIGIPPLCIALFERESLLEIGGFRKSDSPTESALDDIRRNGNGRPLTVRCPLASCHIHKPIRSSRVGLWWSGVVLGVALMTVLALTHNTALVALVAGSWLAALLSGAVLAACADLNNGSTEFGKRILRSLGFPLWFIKKRISPIKFFKSENIPNLRNQ